MAERLAQDPANYIVIVDNLLTGSHSKVPKSIHQNVQFIKADVNDQKEISAIFLAYRFDYVFHYAAVVGVKRTWRIRSWCSTTLRDQQHPQPCEEHRCKTGLYTSSSEVYGEPVSIPRTNIPRPSIPRLPYAIVKNVGEAYLRSFKREYDLDFTIFRLFNTYGPKQSTDFVISEIHQRCPQGPGHYHLW